jgi:hypothetical protein
MMKMTKTFKETILSSMLMNKIVLIMIIDYLSNINQKHLKYRRRYSNIIL